MDKRTWKICTPDKVRGHCNELANRPIIHLLSCLPEAVFRTISGPDGLPLPFNEFIMWNMPRDSEEVDSTLENSFVEAWLVPNVLDTVPLDFTSCNSRSANGYVTGAMPFLDSIIRHLFIHQG